MKNLTILSIIGLLVFSIIGLAQISSAENLSESSTPTTTATPTTPAIQMPATETTTVPAPAIPTTTFPTPYIPTTKQQPTPTTTTQAIPFIVPPTTTPTTSPIKKCGVNSFGVSNECGVNVYKNVYVQCYDGYETNLGAVESSCKTSELWQQYAKEACVGHCSVGGRASITPTQTVTSTSGQVTIPTQIPTSTTSIPAPAPAPAQTQTPTPVQAPEISTYYKARLEKVSSIKNGGEKQIQELKALRNEIDKLISNLINSRKEFEVGELNTLVKEVKVSQGEINADNIKVETTGKKIFVDVGDRVVSVEPTVDQVLIRDKGLEVNTDEVMIKENVMSVGGVNVEMSASEVTEKLGLVPTTIELKKENDKAVYNIQVDERRKLFGFIPFNSEKTISANALNGDILGEDHPWYNFLTTK